MKSTPGNTATGAVLRLVYLISLQTIMIGTLDEKLIVAVLPFEMIYPPGCVLAILLAFWTISVEGHTHFNRLAWPKTYFPIPFQVDITLGG
jgi:hypothetical protein